MEPNTTPELVHSNATDHPDLAFLNFYDEITTYGALDGSTNAFANYLSGLGIGAGDVVAYMLDNSPAVFDVLLGIQKIGAIATPVSCWWQAGEVQYLLNDSGASVLVIDLDYAQIAAAVSTNCPELHHVLVNSSDPIDSEFTHDLLPEVLATQSVDPPPAPPPGPDDSAALMYTSGTTGQPKGVMLSHRGIVAGARMKTKLVSSQTGERALCVLPLFHSGGLNDLALPTMYGAGTIVLRKGFSASEFWDCVERYRVNAFYIVPTMWNILLRAPEAETVDTSSVRFAISGAAPIPAEQLEECKERFGIPILEGYGTTETSGGITANSFDRSKYGSIGIPFDGLDVAVFDDSEKALPPGEVGEIVVRGETVMQGYYHRPEATAETIVDGWLHTGDMGYVDEDGFLFIADRRKDLIIRGGVNVYPNEIEKVIADHSGVSEVAVIPEADDKYGQIAKACVVPEPGTDLDEAEIQRFCAERLAAYKVPAEVTFRERLPRNVLGKVLKRELIRELVEEETAEPVPVAYLFEGMLDRFMPEAATGVDASVSYHITGGGGGDWTIVIKDGAVHLIDVLADDATVTISARDAVYHDVTYGVLDSVTAVVNGKLTVDGDASFMAKFRELFRPIDTRPNRIESQ